MGLLALPALWIGREGATVVQMMMEAIECVVPLDVSYVNMPWLPAQPPLTGLRIGRQLAGSAERVEWEPTLRAWEDIPLGMTRGHVDCPLGRCQVVRLAMGYHSQSGSIWFGSSQPDFPTVTQMAFLRAAASLAATGVQSARLHFEREEANRAKDEFLAMLGHELRNPLAPIVTSLALIKRRANEPATSEYQVIERQVSHLRRLVDDLLDVTRITRGKVDLQMAPLTIKSILTNALEAVSPLLEQNRHKVSMQITDSNIWVAGDSTRLTQVFANLLTNAAKYTDPGGHIWVTSICDEAKVQVSIRDNGSGISASLMPRLFDIFQQGNSTIERSRGGLGIGLALVKNLVELHGGTVQAHSEGPGTGSEFTVTLPRTHAPTADVLVAPTLDHKEPQGLTGGVRVMVVEDNLDALESMLVLLEGKGFKVIGARDPIEALGLAADFHPEIAIVDIGLPGMDGYELAIELRQRMSGEPLRLLALTGYGQATDRKRSEAAGFEHHLVKPVEVDELFAVLRGMSISSA